MSQKSHTDHHPIDADRRPQYRPLAFPSNHNTQGAPMAEVHALVVTGNGTNCHKESAYALEQAGAKAEVAFFSDLTAGRVSLDDYRFLLFPGGFLDGDDLGAAQAAALRWKFATTKDGAPLLDQLKAFLDKGGLVLGICNGFQLLVKLGLLPALDGEYFSRQATLSLNDSGRFEDRWVHLKADPESPCVFTKGLDRLEMPVRHGEGKLYCKDEGVLSALRERHLAPLHYIDPENGEAAQDYPANPNGSPFGIAALTDPTGRIMGLMPHPEAYNHRTNHPRWTRGEDSVLGTVLLKNGVDYLKQNAGA